MPYPQLQKQRLIVNGVDLSEIYGLILVDGYSLGLPEIDTKTVSVAGVEVLIDLTESLIGDAMFKNRINTFTLCALYPKNFEALKTKVYNFLHGKRYDYKLSFDPDYTYTGRFTITSCAYTDIIGSFSISVDTEPYKKKDDQVFELNAYHGRLYNLPSGRKPVRPKLQCDNVCYVRFNDVEYAIPAGTHTLNKVLFKEGQNDIYLNTKREFLTKWSDLAEGGSHAKKWSELTSSRWDNVYVIIESDGKTLQSWSDLSAYKWNDISDKTWAELNYVPITETRNVIAYLTYEWGDL